MRILFMIWLLIGCAANSFELIPGPKGDGGEDGQVGDTGESIEGPTGSTGSAGQSGKDGTDGKDGVDGIGCETIQTTDGSMIMCGDSVSVTLNGKDGADGQDGKDAEVIGLITSASTTECQSGGFLDVYFIDVNHNNQLDQNEPELFRRAICNGIDGEKGENGTNGKDGKDGIDATSTVLLGQGNSSDFRHGWELFGDDNLILYELGQTRAAYDNNLAEWHVYADVVFGLQIGVDLIVDQAKYLKCNKDRYIDYHTTEKATAGRTSKWYRQKLNQFNPLNNYSDVQGFEITAPYRCP